MEGEETGEWVLVDLGDMIVHIMQPAIRAYYRLEEIWGEKEVKFGAAVRTKRSASDEAPKKSRHLTSDRASEEVKPKKPGVPRKPKAAADAAPAKSTAKPAAKSRAKAPSKPVGKTVKVAATKTAVASKGAAAKKAATKGPARAPAKRAPAKPKAEE